MTEAQPSSAFTEPDHPDHALLQEVLSRLLADQEVARDEHGERFDLEAYVARYVDSRSLAYVALQRALAVFRVTSPEALAQQMPLLMRACAYYLEGFILGVEIERSRSEG